MKNVGNSGRGRSQGVQKIFRAPICTAHCAVIFATAQLSSLFVDLMLQVNDCALGPGLRPVYDS